MSLNHSPSVVTNGLVMYADMTNTKKSWLGQPTVNQFAIPTPDGSGNVTFAVQGTGTFQRIYSGTYGGYEIQPSDIVYKYVLGAAPTGCHYHGNTISATIGQTPTWSFDYYIDPSTTGYPVTNYLANIESSIGVGAGLTDPTPSVIGVWKRATQTSAAATSNGTFNAYLYPGACGTQMATGGFILYKNPQVEFNSFATPFVAGTRSNTRAIVDLTGNNTITATSLTYASDGTFNFAGSSYANVNYNSILDLINTVSLCAWVKYTASTNVACIEKSNNNTHYQFQIFSSAQGSGMGGELVFMLQPNSSNWVTATVASNDNNWHYVVGTYDRSSTTAKIYIDGVLKNTNAAITTGPTSNTSDLLIGSRSGTAAGMGGSISVVKIYSRVLTAAEVAQNFNALRGRYSI